MLFYERYTKSERKMEFTQERIRSLNRKELGRGRYILYWMQQSQRVADNPALEFALTQAQAMSLPLVVLFVVVNDFPDANLRHYNFMLEGLAETFNTLKQMKIEAVIKSGRMVEKVVETAREAVLLVTDTGYLRIQNRWREEISRKADCHMVEVEGDVLFPVEQVMQKEAYSAKVLRDRIYKIMTFEKSKPASLRSSGDSETIAENFLRPVQRQSAQSVVQHWNTELLKSGIDASVENSNLYPGGYSEALKHLRFFTDKLLHDYNEKRNDPGDDYQSRLSPYLHFGQISVREVLRQVIESLDMSDREFYSLVLSIRPGAHQEGRVNGALELFEEMIVRRELAMNFCHFNDEYDEYSALPEWARMSLRSHAGDPRPYLYSPDELENASTHDQYWNAAQLEMVKTGKMHGYMRMYWGKKLIEWTAEPEEAFAIAQYLNNKYELDGRSPNGYAGIAWCFGKHDRAWPSHPVFGKVRIMKDSGLERKFDMQKYINRIELL